MKLLGLLPIVLCTITTLAGPIFDVLKPDTGPDVRYIDNSPQSDLPLGKEVDRRRQQMGDKCDICMGVCLWSGAKRQCLVHCSRTLGYVCRSTDGNGGEYQRSKQADPDSPYNLPDDQRQSSDEGSKAPLQSSAGELFRQLKEQFSRYFGTRSPSAAPGRGGTRTPLIPKGALHKR